MHKSSWIILGLVIFGIVGSLILSWSPFLGVIFILCGFGGSFWSIFSNEKRHKKNETIQEIQTELLAKSGAGNVYYQSFEKNFTLNGYCENAVELLRKAISIDPNNYDSLLKLAGILVLQLSSRQGITGKQESVQKTEIDEVKKLAKQASLLRPKVYDPHTIMGMVLDVEGKHKQARREFKRTGDLGYSEWHFCMSTSWGMEGNNVKSLKEAKIGIKENSDYHWGRRFVYGRSLLHNGKYAAALIQLRIAYKIRGVKPELMKDLSTAYYFLGHMCYAAYLQTKGGLWILPIFPKTAIYQIIQAFIHFLLGFLCICSKQVWHISKCSTFTQKIHLFLSSPYEPEATLSNMLLEQKHYNMALVHAKNAVKICPTVAGLWINLSNLHQLLGHEKLCLNSIQYAIRLEPKNLFFQYQKEQILAVYENRAEDLLPPKNIPKKHTKGYVFKTED